MTDTAPRELHPAEIEKLNAEAAAARARVALHDAERSKAEAEAREIQYRAEELRIDLERETEKRRRELAANEHHHVYMFAGAVGGDTVRKCIEQLTQWMRNDPGCDIEIVFNSPGGLVIEGMALFDYIQQVRRSGHKVTTHTLGYAASMAGILLQAGDVRVMGKEAWLMIHEASFGAGGKIGDVEDQVEWVKRVCDRILDIFADRSNLTKRQLAARWRRKDWWISSDEALRLGLVDEVR